ncbi:hypothetical protein NCG97_18485 [Streptomyces lydicamycinicus]|uniref:hypothetical protein n=1 Tax=Streptomyces lydicamycinicus TaxID=1546107 RepID=UPI002034C136|nr:hypothetical protein [Streptomyces lydicamycinicus]USA05483.1 hypothetical protein NCG97_18485 [Streptomyces lydicamycinicus]
MLLPAEAVRAVRNLVGTENTAAFIAAAAHREVQARTMDALVALTPNRATDQASEQPSGRTPDRTPDQPVGRANGTSSRHRRD